MTAPALSSLLRRSPGARPAAGVRNSAVKRSIGFRIGFYNYGELGPSSG